VLSACTRDDATWASDGPVRTPDPHASYLHFGPGEVFTYGLERVLLDGDLDGRLVKVEVVGAGDHVEFLGARLAGPDRRVGSIQLIPGYPPANPDLGTLVPAAGATLTRSRVGHELLVGLRVLEAGFATVRGLRIYYTVGGDRFQAFYDAQLVFCPDDITEDACVTQHEQQGG
jgi:hypothetical protein